MLQYRAVYPATLELLKQLMRLPSLRDYYLVGGTALALHLGHRISVDLDLFSLHVLDRELILKEIQEIAEIESVHPEILTLTVQGVKVDILQYPYPMISSPLEEDGIRLLAVEDIIPMKLSAIANRGAKKDFFDIAVLLESYPLPEMLSLFQQKFPKISTFHVVKSLTYFDDAEEEADPIMLIQVSWDQVKGRIERAVEKLML